MGLRVTDCPSCGNYAEHKEVSGPKIQSDESVFKCDECGEKHTFDELN